MSGDLRLILFDVDGTLADSEGTIVQCMQEAFEMYERKPVKQDILSIVGLSLPEAVAQLAPDLHPESRDIVVGRYKDAYHRARVTKGAGHSPLYPGAAEVLAELNAVPHYLLGVATGKSQRGLDALIEAHELRCFVTRQCADHHPSKPHPSMVLRAMAETGVLPEHTVMIGDTSFDIDMGRAAGVRTIAVNWGFHPADQLGADHIIDSFADLAPLLQHIWKD
ncbi:HAD-IA family hydrolase [Phaeobacter sp. HS012]|uniref:HAD-IA family hydrolase n=1 Tax=unclassified Phaeobacter TaxID=2621772 RepID=UPI001B377522|nr:MULTISPECIES: HAD-IA family hydrolase [unclassified Phaeobacter]MBQ4808141.1 HAD-IA family hydrolase [Phaeobacter sp. HS012]MBQ4882990.1 HAD-IA family hydrolase [Phaeobacter sp. HS011]